ncbi:non-ribosomal peptide synthetase [Sphaerospermopsis torques-reginae]|uniref:Amino acid adenylation domain-containing protein n=1 Tax=Sphaerospermopsis torques-reginae ITEP-024 TaxID=984208 RepID=A0A1L4BMJ4_9CYAN|nr:non-ribosomal peptide synthetase [Sphaerospermopsis torques-reginae]API83198.1 non-ribosomal peptide synthetase [Sphaerospermopsis torques-reginae ITEP-024]QYX31924.1 amino acid adenylation domain-containing protein [Sphaerospermopsis torques-reginae ITEP-024]
MTMTQNQQVVSLMLRLQNMGCRIWAEDDKLRIRTSKNALTAELKQEIQNNKADILAFLKAAKKQVVATQSIPKLSPDSPKLLSFAQQRLWLLAQLQGSSAAYNMPIALQLNGDLNIDALRSSLAYLLNRHESLRMYFPTVAGEPQVALGTGDWGLVTGDWEEVGEKFLQFSNIQDLIDAYAQEPFDLNTGPLFKTKLLQLQDQKYILLINMHHIISDGWSMGVFVRELQQAYTAYSQGKIPNLAPLPIQYSDYAAWQRQWLQGEILEKQINYWKNQLGDFSPLLELPTDYPRPAQQSYKGDRYIYSFTPELTTAVNAFSQQQGVSLYMTLLATLSILLSRYSRQNDLCIGSPIANRTHSQTEGLIGFFVNTLVMRQQIKPEQSFIEFLQQTRQTCLDAYAHQDVAFDVLVEKLHPERSMSYNPLFQVMLALENNQNPDFDLAGLDMELLGVKSAIAKFDLTLLITESDNQLNCSWEYATDLFARCTIQRMAEHFAVLLKGIIDHPQQPIYTLPLMTGEELLKLQRSNQTQTDYFQDKTFVDLFAEQVLKNPHNIAVVFESHVQGNREQGTGNSKELNTLTYQQLNAKAEQLADYLIENYQVHPDTLIGISVERSLEMIIGFLGIMKAGGAYVPIDPNYPQERIELMLEDSGISVLLTQSFVVDKLPLDSLANPIEFVYLDEELDKYPSPIVNCQLSTVNYNNLAYVIYTSGSTGKPKGVMIEHGGLVNLILAVDEILQIQPQSRVLQFANFSFDASIWEIAPTLSAGACLYLTKKENLLPSQELIDFLTEYKITHVTLPPSVLSLLPHATLPDLQILITGGEVCPKELVTRWAKGRSFFNGYGPTESTICTSIALCQPNGKKPLIGKPLSNLRIYILDAHNQPLPPGIPGELCIAGVGLARGYLHRPELTAEKFIEVELFGEVERIYKTGDLARWKDDGNLEYLGRIDEQVKLRGFRIELGEIESLLLQHPLVKEAVVTLYQTDSNQSLIAYVTGIDPDFGSNLKKYLKSSLPDYMIPAQIVVLEQLPLTPNGKIDKKALPIPNVGIAGLYVAPRNKVEAQLAQLWSTVLEHQEIGIHDNFFDLGGHSLLVIKLLNNIQEMFGQKLTLSSLFQNPTIAQLAEQISNKESNKEVQKAHPDVLLFQPQGNANPLFVVPGANGHGFYFQDLAINLENHPVYSLETPGRNGIGKVPDSVELHGSQLIDLLSQKQPQGPYILAGYSSGCAVAFEMACQLEKQGKKVELLAILDAGLVTHPEYLIKRTDIDWIWQLLQRAETVKGVSLGLEYTDLAAQSDDQARWDLAAEFLYKKNVLPEYSSLDLLKTNMQVMKQLTINYANYRPSHQISAPIVLFRAEEVYDIVLQEIRAISNYDLPDWGWQAYTTNPVKVISVPGNHGRMLYEPNVKTLASHLRLMMI